MRKIDDVLREDHVTFIDIEHHVPFVELCNDMIHTYYDEINVDIELDIEFNDGCASQIKCIHAIYLFASRNMQCIPVYFETSHGKSKSNDLGGVVKGYASREVASKNVLIRNKKELYEFCKEKLEVTNSEEGKMFSGSSFLCQKSILLHIKKPSLHQVFISIFLMHEKSTSCSNSLCQIQEFIKDAFYPCVNIVSVMSLANAYYIDHETFMENPALIKPQWKLFKKTELQKMRKI